MIGAWMLHALTVSALVAVAALALDRLLRPHGVALRWIWAGALLLGAGLPAMAALPGATLGSRLAVGPGGGLPVVVLEALTVTAGDGSILQRLDPFLAGGWVALSLLLLLLGGHAVLRLGRIEEGWTLAEVGETPVLLTDDTGPAVVGLFGGRIVLPSWLLEEEDGDRLELTLLHERQHLEARDPLLLGAAFLVLTALPWNPVLWWVVRRLREAVEVDCDRRVLRRRPDRVRRYAETLMEVSRRGRSLRGSPAALAEPRSFLERRIRTMTSVAPKHVLRRGLALGGVALLALAGACLAPEPDADGPRETPVEVTEDEGAEKVVTASDIADEPVRTPLTYKPDILNRREVVRAMEEAYPTSLKEAGVGGRIAVWFLVDRSGDIETVEVKESSGHEALDRAALRVARVFDFTPARNGEERVPAWFALPITFVAE